MVPSSHKSNRDLGVSLNVIGCQVRNQETDADTNGHSCDLGEPTETPPSTVCPSSGDTERLETSDGVTTIRSADNDEPMASSGDTQETSDPRHDGAEGIN